MTYAIAADHDSTGSLTDITSITPPGGTAFLELTAYSNYAPGAQSGLGSGAVRREGSAFTEWTFTLMTDAQYAYLYDTFQTVNNGKVTIRTRNYSGTFTTYNARIVLPPREELTYRNDTRRYFQDVTVRFVRVRPTS